MTNIDQVWPEPALDHNRRPCPYCAQPTVVRDTPCKVCEGHMKGAVLTLCRYMLNRGEEVSGAKKDAPKPGGETESNARRVPVIAILERFPFALSERTARFRKSLENEGAWFAHVNAFLMLRSVRPADWTGARIAEDPLYLMLRERFVEFLAAGGKRLRDDHVETVLNVYNNPGARLDGRRVIMEMMLRLEQQGAIKIERAENFCANCGVRIDPKNLFCQDCDEVAALDRRRAIASAMKFHAPRPGDGDGSSASARGMHVKKD